MTMTMDQYDLYEGWKALPYEFQRDATWLGWGRIFVQLNGRGERPMIWTCEVKDGRAVITYGLLDGQMQTTDFVGKAKNVGRANAITAAQDCLNEARRECTKKWDYEGYREVFSLDEARGLSATPLPITHLLTNLPGSFTCEKPNGEPSKRLAKLADQGKVKFGRKRDGLAYWCVIGANREVLFYSRRSRLYHDLEGPAETATGRDYSKAIPWAARFPHLVAEVESMQLPAYTMLAGELVCIDASGSDNFPLISSYTKSLTPQSLADQAKYGLPYFYVWELPFYAGQDLISTLPAGQRLDYLVSLFDYMVRCGRPLRWCTPVEFFSFPNQAAAIEHAKAQKFEGFVMIDPHAVYGDRAWNLKGKPDRPEGAAKLKPRGEDDFIARWEPDKTIGTWGTGKHEANKQVKLPSGELVIHGGVGSVGLFQYNSAGEEIYICDCSSGMDYEFQAKLRPEHFPFVCQIEYLSRTYVKEGDKTDALRHPVFVRRRDDKLPSECINVRL